MLDYTGIKCPVCQVPFQAGDDIVVCPQCGAPYHRECYQKEGKCIFDDLHEAQKDWAPPQPPKAPDPSAEIKDRECPVCGTLNGHSALFCSRCNASLVGEPQKYNNSAQNQAPNQPPPPPYTPYGVPPQPRTGFGGTVPPFAFDPMGGVSPAEPLDTNVTFGDASKLVKQSTGYYMPVFRYIKQTGRNKFNFSAFLFSGAWMLYRKQYKWGSIVTGLMFLLYLAYLCTSMFIASPLLFDLMEQVGMDVTQGFSPTSGQMLAITQLMQEDFSLYLRIALPMICLLLMLVVMIVVGVRGNKMYMKHCISTLKTIKKTELNNDFNAALELKGGVNTSIAICLFVCYLIVINIPLLL